MGIPSGDSRSSAICGALGLVARHSHGRGNAWLAEVVARVLRAGGAADSQVHRASPSPRPIATAMGTGRALGPDRIPRGPGADRTEDEGHPGRAAIRGAHPGGSSVPELEGHLRGDRRRPSGPRAPSAAHPGQRIPSRGRDRPPRSTGRRPSTPLAQVECASGQPVATDPGRRRRGRPDRSRFSCRSETSCSAASPEPASRLPSRCWWLLLRSIRHASSGCSTASSSSSPYGVGAHEGTAGVSCLRGHRGAAQPARGDGPVGTPSSSANGRRKVAQRRRACLSTWSSSTSWPTTSPPRTGRSEPRSPISSVISFLADERPGSSCLLRPRNPPPTSIPTSIRDLFGFRWAMRCSTPQASDTILGSGWASAGLLGRRRRPGQPRRRLPAPRGRHPTAPPLLLPRRFSIWRRSRRGPRPCGRPPVDALGGVTWRPLDRARLCCSTGQLIRQSFERWLEIGPLHRLVRAPGAAGRHHPPDRPGHRRDLSPATPPPANPTAILLKACGTRRATVCRAVLGDLPGRCLALIVAGMRGGKGVPDGCRRRIRSLFVTLTAPSFGAGSYPTGEGRLGPDVPSST